MAPGRGTISVCAARSLCWTPDRNHGNIQCKRAAKSKVQRPANNRAGRWQEQEPSVANILVNIEKGIEIGAEDALKWLTCADKALHTTPTVIASLAVLVASMEKPLAELGGAIANPLNIPLDIETAADLKAAWPEVMQFLRSLGVKF
jgi:hypothetical protein